MLTLLIGTSGLTLAVLVFIFVRSDADERGFNLSMAVLPVLIIAFIVSLVTAGVLGSSLPKKAVVLERHHLISMHDATGISGRFFLASGTISGNNYIYYVEATDKGYQFKKMDETDGHVYVREENRDDAELDVVVYQFQDASAETWALPADGTDYIFHVPTGTITTCFTLAQGGSTGCPAS